MALFRRRRNNNQASYAVGTVENLDYRWVGRVFSKRQANASAVAVAETKDPHRFNQLVAALLGDEHYRHHHLYSFDPWQGLVQWNASGWSPVSVEANAYAPPQASGGIPPLSELSTALRHVDPLLKSQPTVLLLRNLEASQRNDGLMYALRSWAHDPQVLAHESFIILSLGESGGVLDGLTRDQVIVVAPPLAEAEERGCVLSQVAEKLEVVLGQQAPRLIQATAGLNLHQLQSVLVEAYYRDQNGGFFLPTLQALKDEFIKKSQFVEVEEPQWGFEAVGGYQAVKTFVAEKILQPLQQPDRADRFGVNLPRGVLLFGPPGTGKTLFAKALAKESCLPFINLRTENLYSMYLGESGHRFSEAIRLIEQMSPALVFIDEIDRFGQRTAGGDGASQEARRVFSQVLEWLGDKNRKALVVGTTNALEHLDEAFTRAGRLDYKVPFLYPNRSAREEILAIHLGLDENANVTYPPLGFHPQKANELLRELAEKTADFTGAELEQLIMRARRGAFNSDRNQMMVDDFHTALNSFRIPREARQQQKAHYLQQAQEHTDDSAFLEALTSELSG